MERKYNNKGYFFILPALLFIGFIYFNPIFRITWYSLVNWKYFTPLNFNFFGNYIDLMGTRYFFLTLLNNLFIIIGVVPAITIIALFFAQFIYLKIPGYKIYNFLFFLPVILPDIIVAKIWGILLNKVGPINILLQKIGLSFFVVDWFGNPRFSLLAIIITIIWKNIGFAMILFLARLSTIDRSIYESAKIDGATDVQMFRYISIPVLKNIIQIFIVLQVISLMSFLFNYIYVMTGGGPGFSSTVLEYFVYVNAFKFQDLGKANAASLILIIITVLLISLYTFTMRRQAREIRYENENQ